MRFYLTKLRRSGLLGFVILTVLAGGVGGCSGGDINENDPEKLYQDAESDIKSDRLLHAQESLQRIKNKFPYSRYSVSAKLRLADVFFMQENYPEAAASYESFYELHPKHEKSSYALLRAAESYFKDIPEIISRDLTPAKRALVAYRNFLSKFPTDEQSGAAREKITEINQILANRELYIADFYFKRDLFDSAEGRYINLVKLYPDTSAAKEAENKLRYLRTNQVESKNRPEILKGIDPLPPELTLDPDKNPSNPATESDSR